jgi:hypothetical protein
LATSAGNWHAAGESRYPAPFSAFIGVPLPILPADKLQHIVDHVAEALPANDAKDANAIVEGNGPPSGNQSGVWSPVDEQIPY